MRALAVVASLLLISSSVPAREPTNRLRWNRVVLAATSLLVLGATVMSISVRSRHHDLEETCAPTCNPRDVDALRNRAHVADAFWVMSGLGAATAAGLWWWERRQSKRIEISPAAIRAQW